MQKKVEHTATSKKITDIQADTLQIKKWENGSLLLDIKAKKKNGTYTVLMSNYVSGKADVKLALEVNL